MKPLDNSTCPTTNNGFSSSAAGGSEEQQDSESFQSKVAQWRRYFEPTETTCSVGTMTETSSPDGHNTFVIFGASGDLAKKKIYPTLWHLYRFKLMPKNTVIIGYARSDLTVEQIRSRVTIVPSEDEKQMYEDFWKINFYHRGQYTVPGDFQSLNKLMKTKEDQAQGNRIYYFALPPETYKDVSTNVRNGCFPSTGWSRVIVEKPFGSGTDSWNSLSAHLSSLFKDDETYMIDHYLGKEIIQSLNTVRFANRIFDRSWNRDEIASVTITFKEHIGIDDRAYFDKNGIIRDVMQNHLMQVLSLVIMEKPMSTSAEDIRNKKVEALRYIKPLTAEDVVIGQYVSNPEGKESQKKSYKDNQSVAPDSNTPTFAFAMLKVHNERWEGVPFFLKCGKALNERKAEVRIQFKDVSGDVFEGKAKRNELVIRVQPNEAVYLKMNTKTPGMKFDIEETELDLTYGHRYESTRLPDAYERLILDVFMGSQVNFVRGDEVTEAWRIFTPLLRELESVKPIDYMFGTRGPQEADDMAAKNGFKFSGTYTWKPKESKN